MNFYNLQNEKDEECILVEYMPLNKFLNRVGTYKGVRIFLIELLKFFIYLFICV